MKLCDLLKGVKAQGEIADVEISGIAVDSRKVRVGDVFIALEGESEDGHKYIKEAILQGAAAVVVSKHIEDEVIIVEDTRVAYAVICANFYGNPQEKLKMVAVTGTNGKTTTTHILQHILNQSGVKTASIGTLGYNIGGNILDCLLTTPDPDMLFNCLAGAVEQGVEVVVMEVSAHAIYYKKVHNIQFDVGIYTNISQDHLDFFENIENYSKVKQSFFNKTQVKFSLINIDDSLGRIILEDTSLLSVSYGLEQPSDIFAIDIEQSNKGTTFILNAFDQVAEINLPLPGIYNIYNTLAAIGAAIVLNIPIPEIKYAITKLSAPPGRFNVINKDIMVIIDYAHTPGGLENLLKAVTMFKKGKTITVFGCGGNRDKAKRPLMGAIAQTHSDLVVLTSDNPRLEEPLDIIEQISKGMTQGYICEPDRSKAIELALKLALPNDIVVIAGKGSEDYLDIHGSKIPYSDMEEVNKYLEEKR